MAPGLVAGALLVLISAQLTRILAPGHGPYLWTLALAAAGFLGGEAAALVTGAGGPRLGALHPVADLMAIAILQVAGALAVAPLTRRRGEP